MSLRSLRSSPFAASCSCLERDLRLHEDLVLPRSRNQPGSVGQDPAGDQALIFRLDLRVVSPDVVVEAARELEEAVLSRVAIEPVEVRLRLDRSPAIAELAMEAISGLRLPGPPIEPVPVEDEQRLCVAGQRHV